MLRQYRVRVGKTGPGKRKRCGLVWLPQNEGGLGSTLVGNEFLSAQKEEDHILSSRCRPRMMKRIYLFSNWTSPLKKLHGYVPAKHGWGDPIYFFFNYKKSKD